MKRWLGVAVWIVLLGACDELLMHEMLSYALDESRITASQAIQVVAKQDPEALLVEVELEFGERFFFEVRVVSGQAEVVLRVDAITGDIVPEEAAQAAFPIDLYQAAKTLNSASMTLARAIQIAESHVQGGRTIGARVEDEEGAAKISVGVLTDDGGKVLEIDSAGNIVVAEEWQRDGQAWIFERDELGKEPGWTLGFTAPEGGNAIWTVEGGGEAPFPKVLALKASSDSRVFNVAMAEGTSFKDVSVETSLRADGGEVDQGGGVTWRCKDLSNYYICRINPLEDNFRVYKVIDGKRTQLATADFNTEPGKWYQVNATMVADKIECFVDGKKLLEATDSTLASAGMVGLWTKADASTSFDNMTAREVKPEAASDS